MLELVHSVVILSYGYFSLVLQFQCLCLTLLVIIHAFIICGIKFSNFINFENALHYRTRQACMDLASFPVLRREGSGNEASLDYTLGYTSTEMPFTSFIPSLFHPHSGLKR